MSATRGAEGMNDDPSALQATGQASARGSCPSVSQLVYVRLVWTEKV
jgi:hypothetical protein